MYGKFNVILMTYIVLNADALQQQQQQKKGPICTIRNDLMVQ